MQIETAKKCMESYKENPSEFILEQAMLNLACSSEGSIERIEALKFLKEVGGLE